MLNTINATAIGNSIDTLGNHVDALNWEDAVKQAGLNWTVDKLQHKSPRSGELVNSFGIYRNDNDNFLGQVGNSYTPIQNVDQFKFVDDLIGNIDGAHYVAAGQVDGGQKVFCAAHLGKFSVGDEADEHNAYLVVSDWKNSRGSCKAQVSINRKVCQNGMHRFMADSAMNFRHTPNVQRRMDAVAKSIDIIKGTLFSFKSQLDTLASRKVTREQVTSILDRLFPPSEAETRGRNNYTRLETQKVVLELLASNDNDAFPSEAKTAYAVYNAVTNYVDHHQATKNTTARAAMSSTERRADNAMFGRGAEFKSNALDVILETTGGQPVIETSYGSLLDEIISNN